MYSLSEEKGQYIILNSVLSWLFYFFPFPFFFMLFFRTSKKVIFLAIITDKSGQLAKQGERCLPHHQYCQC